MRIYCIHVYRRRWEFYPNEPPFEEPDPIESEEKPTGFIHWLQTKVAQLWQSIDEANSGVRGWVRSAIQLLNRRVDPTEPMLRRMRTAERIEIVHPCHVSPRFVRRRLRLLLLRKAARHRRLTIVNAVLMPLTAAAVVLPGPNVFFFWNAYRFLSHLFAARGARRVLGDEVTLVLTPSTELDARASHERKASAPLDVTGASQIAEQFRLPGLVEYLRRTGGLAGDAGGPSPPARSAQARTANR
jgi:hypothetical protein